MAKSDLEWLLLDEPTHEVRLHPTLEQIKAITYKGLKLSTMPSWKESMFFKELVKIGAVEPSGKPITIPLTYVKNPPTVGLSALIDEGPQSSPDPDAKSFWQGTGV